MRNNNTVTANQKKIIDFNYNSMKELLSRKKLKTCVVTGLEVDAVRLLESENLVKVYWEETTYDEGRKICFSHIDA